MRIRRGSLTPQQSSYPGTACVRSQIVFKNPCSASIFGSFVSASAERRSPPRIMSSTPLSSIEPQFGCQLKLKGHLGVTFKGQFRCQFKVDLGKCELKLSSIWVDLGQR